VLSINLSYCKGCSICVEICARHAMSMVPERTQP
jgi:Pyruvate/2-oxoacid:ferredoxin oxidoreductase delta subunit